MHTVVLYVFSLILSISDSFGSWSDPNNPKHVDPMHCAGVRVPVCFRLSRSPCTISFAIDHRTAYKYSHGFCRYVLRCESNDIELAAMCASAYFYIRNIRNIQYLCMQKWLDEKNNGYSIVQARAPMKTTNTRVRHTTNII